LAHEDLGAIVSALLPADVLEGFATRHGVDPRELDLLVVAGYGEEGALVLAEGPFVARVVVGEIGHRMSPLESQSDDPFYRRAGVYLRRRFELIALGQRELALVSGPPALSGLVLHQLRADEAGVSPAPGEEPEGLSPQRVRTILLGERDAPFVVVQHGRPELPPEGVGLLLARLEDAVLSVAPSAPGSLALRVRLYGEFPPGADENFRTLIASLSEADLGRALGLEEIARSLAIEVVGPEIRLTATVRAATLSRGLRMLAGAEISEMLELAR
jgi:hypothetical protein